MEYPHPAHYSVLQTNDLHYEYNSTDRKEEPNKKRLEHRTLQVVLYRRSSVINEASQLHPHFRLVFLRISHYTHQHVFFSTNCILLESILHIMHSKEGTP